MAPKLHTRVSVLFPLLSQPIRVCRCLLLLLSLQCLTTLVSSQDDTGYVLNQDVLSYIDTVAKLLPNVANPSLDTIIVSVATDLGFNRLSFYWQAPTRTDRQEDFAQVALGRQNAACFAVFHGLPIPDEDSWFSSSPVPLPNNDNLLRADCDEAFEDCTCRAHWAPMLSNFPDYWQELQSELDSCMTGCLSQYSDCDMVLGGFGEGGMVAALLSFHFADTYAPYVIGVGSPNVLYDSGCSGIDPNRYFRFVNVADSTSSGDGDYGICFDKIPFLGQGSLVDIGYTIGLGGTEQVILFDQGATRTSLCRNAHDATTYASKMERAYVRNPNGFTPIGFSETQNCEVDQDCQRGSMCTMSGTSGFPECTAAVPLETSSPTLNPTSNPPTPLPTDLITYDPTMSPTFTTLTPTGSPTSAPTRNPTPIPSSQPPTEVPTPYPTAVPPTPLPTHSPRPTPRPISTPEPTYTPRPTPRPTLTPRPTPLPTLTPRPTIKPTTALPSPRPSPIPTTQNPIFALVLSPLAPSTARPTLAQSLPPATSLPPLSDTFDPTFSPSDSTPLPTPPKTSPTRSSSPTEPGTTEEPTALVETDTFSPTADNVIINVVPGNNTSSNSSSSTEQQVLPPTEQPELQGTSPAPVPVYSIENDFFRVTLVLNGVVTKLGGFTVFRWEDETSEHLQDSILKYTEELGWDPPLMQLKVQANIVTQTLLYGFVTEERSVETNLSNVASAVESEPKSEGNGQRRHARGRWRRDRRVQETQVDSLQIVFEVAVSYRTPDPTRNGELDLLKMILKAFQSEDGREEYTQRLKDSDDPTFASLSGFVLQVEASDGLNIAANQAANDGEGEDDTMLWAIIVAASVAAVSMVLLLFCYWRRSAIKQQKLEDANDSGKATNLLEDAIFEPASNENRANPQ